MKNNTTNNKQYKQKGLLMKTKLSVFAGAFCAFVLLGTTSAFASGTPAGTEIKNVAKMTYKDFAGTSYDTLFTDTARVTVEQVAGVTVTPVGSLKYSSDSLYVFFPHTVTNTGNGTDTYTLAAADSASWGASIFFDIDGQGDVDAADTAAAAITTTGSMAADATYKILVRLFVPNGKTSGLLDTNNTKATSSFNTAVLAWVRDSIRTRVTEIALTKTNNNGTPTPGQTITYTITYNNSGTGTGKNAELRDTLNSNLTFVSAVVNSGGGSATTTTGGLGELIVIWSGIGNSGNVYGGLTGQLTIQATVNVGVAAGTSISNRAYMVYNDSIGNRTKRPPAGPTVVVVAGSGAWELQVTALNNNSFTTDNDDDSVQVNQGIFFRVKVKNNGNRTDSLKFTTRTSTASFTWFLFRDVDSNGVYLHGTDTVIKIASDTIVVPRGGTAYFFAADTSGHMTADRIRDSAYYLVTSLTLGASDNGYHITRIKAPVMTLTKSVVTQTSTWGGGTRSRPGDSLIYIITYTNTGSGNGYSIVVLDNIPANTSLIADSIKIDYSTNGGGATGDGTHYVSKTDAVGDDIVDVAAGTITVTLGTVGPRMTNDPTHTGKIRFLVKIN